MDVVELLLKDPRVDTTLADDEGCTPLWYAFYNGYYEGIEWFIASGRDWETTSKGIGKGKNKPPLRLQES